MFVGVMRLSLRVPEAQSLKEKRWLLKSLAARIRNRFNVSIAEIDAQDKWQLASIGVAHVSSTAAHTHHVLDRVLDFAEAVKQIEVLDSKTELL